MDETLRILRRQIQSGDIDIMYKYIIALERALGINDDDNKPINSFLLSYIGDKHEDRLPVGIFTSFEEAIEGAKKELLRNYEADENDITVSIYTQNYVEYKFPSKEVYISLKDDEREGNMFIVDKFELDDS